MMRTGFLREIRHDFSEEHVLVMHWEKGISGVEAILLSCKGIAGWGRIKNALNTEEMKCVCAHVHTCVWT